MFGRDPNARMGDDRLSQLGGGYPTFGPLNKTLRARFGMRLRQYLGDQALAEGHDINWYRNHPDPRVRNRLVNNFFKDPKLQEKIFGTARLERGSLPDWHARIPEALGPALKMTPEDRQQVYKQFQQQRGAYSGAYNRPNPLGQNYPEAVFWHRRRLFPTAGVIPLHLRLG